MVIIFYYLKKYKYFILLFLIVNVIFIFFLTKRDKSEEIVFESFNESDFEEEISSKIKIDIKGAVLNPGVYELDNNSRVEDAILKSGGLTNDADTSILNLSKNLKDEMVIIIYTKDEINKLRKGSETVKYIEKECICPKIENDACIDESITNNEEKESTKVSLNNATLNELMTLPGIGKSKAETIIEYRNSYGFKTIDELKKVSGIGDKTYEKLKDKITI